MNVPAPGAVVLTRQGNGKVSEVSHHHVADRVLACRRNGVIATTTLVTVDGGEVTCRRCLRALGRAAEAAALVAPPPDPARPVSAQPGRAGTTLHDYDPIDHEPGPIPAHDPEVPLAAPGRSITAGELVAMLLAGRVRADLPIRCMGTVHPHSALGVMVSLDGSLVLMDTT